MDGYDGSTDDSPVSSVSCVRGQLRLRLWHYDTVCLYSQRRCLENEECSYDLADPAQPAGLFCCGHLPFGLTEAGHGVFL
jgi:hypothetical protein